MIASQDNATSPWPLTHVPCPDVHRDELRLVQVGVLDLHQLQQLAKGLSLLRGDMGVLVSQRGGAAPQKVLVVGSGGSTPRRRHRLAGVVSALRPLVCCVAPSGLGVPPGHALSAVGAAYPRVGEDKVFAQAPLRLPVIHQPHLALHALVFDQLQD